MKRCIARFYWGINDKSNRVLARKGRVDGNLIALTKNPYNTEYINLVWGTANAEYLKSLGFKNIELVYKEPYQWDLTTQQYRHKLEGLRICMEELGYDQIVHADYDAYPTKPLPVDFWEQLESKNPIQGNLQQYKKSKCYWRKDGKDIRKVFNGGFIYIGDRSIPSEIIKVYDSPANINKRSCEPAMSLFLDNLNGGWIGVDEFRKRYECEMCNLSRNSCYGRYPVHANACFIHFAGLGSIERDLKRMNLL